MQSLVTKENLQEIETLLYSGNHALIEEGVALVKAKDLELKPFFESFTDFVTTIRWEEAGSTIEQLTAVGTVQILTIYIGANFDEAPIYSFKEKDLIIHCANWDALGTDWGSFLVNLQELTIHNGHIKTLPDTLSELKALEALSLVDVCFQYFPSSFQNLHQLQTLSIYHAPNLILQSCTYFSFSQELSALESLQHLHIESCLFNCITEDIQQMPYLKELYINCDLEALTKDHKSYQLLFKQYCPQVLHFIPATLRKMPCLEKLTLLLPASHLPISTQLFKNVHLRELTLSARLIAQLPLDSKELSRIRKLEIFKPSLMQYLKLVFRLPQAEITPLKHNYQKKYIVYNGLLMLLWWPLGAYFFTTVFFPMPQKKGYLWLKQLLVFMIQIIVYPLSFLFFGIGMLFFSFKR